VAATRTLALLLALAALRPARASDAPAEEAPRPGAPGPRSLEVRVAELRARLEATTGRLAELRAAARRPAHEGAAGPARDAPAGGGAGAARGG